LGAGAAAAGFRTSPFFGPLRVRALVWVRWPRDRQALAVAQAAVAAEIHEPLDVHRDLAPQVALDLDVLLDGLADPPDLVVRQVLRAGLDLDVRLVADGLRGRLPDAVDVLEGDLDPLLTGKVDACDASHSMILRARGLALALLVTGVRRADDPHGSLALDDLALVANLLDRRADLHGASVYCS
jgi:hypothetical protein